MEGLRPCDGLLGAWLDESLGRTIEASEEERPILPRPPEKKPCLGTSAAVRLTLTARLVGSDRSISSLRTKGAEGVGRELSVFDLRLVDKGEEDEGEEVVEDRESGE